MSNSLTFWVNTITGERLDRTTLDGLRARAHDLYEVNTHIFEDELEALTALGAVPMLEIERPVVAA
jgi:hypothetical protein